MTGCESLAAAPKSWRCRHGWHAMRRTKLVGARGSDRRSRHTAIETLGCYRCGFTQQVEHFYRNSYWAEFNRELEDDRLERIIRKAARR